MSPEKRLSIRVKNQRAGVELKGGGRKAEVLMGKSKEKDGDEWFEKIRKLEKKIIQSLGIQLPHWDLEKGKLDPSLTMHLIEVETYQLGKIAWVTLNLGGESAVGVAEKGIALLPSNEQPVREVMYPKLSILDVQMLNNFEDEPLHLASTTDPSGFELLAYEVMVNRAGKVIASNTYQIDKEAGGEDYVRSAKALQVYPNIICRDMDDVDRRLPYEESIANAKDPSTEGKFVEASFERYISVLAKVEQIMRKPKAVRQASKLTPAALQNAFVDEKIKNALLVIRSLGVEPE